MYEFLDIFADVMRIATFQPSRQPGGVIPERKRHAQDAAGHGSRSSMRNPAGGR
jgi:hypothetical protein